MSAPDTIATAKAAPAFEVTNRMVFAIAVPMTLAYLTTPLLGIVDTAVVGQFGDAALIGGLAIGAILFDIVFVTFNFLRMGTTGFVAQAVGRGDETEQQAVFWRAILIALAGGLILLPLSPLIREVGIAIMAPGDAVAEATRTYVTIRFLAAPFTLINYAILGLLLGQARAIAALIVQSFINGINIVLSIALGLWLEWQVAGVAWATVFGEGIVAIGALIWLWRGFDTEKAPSRGRIFDRPAFVALIALNRDIMIRSFALLAAFALFTRIGAQFGAVTLAANAILMNFFFIAGYYLDGFAVAAEQLVGRAIGARHGRPFWRAVKLTALWGFVLAGFTTVVVLVAGNWFIDIMTTAEGVRAEARVFLAWAAFTAVAGVLAFQMDGVYIGATWSVDMRNMMLLSLAVFIAAGYGLTPVFGNHGLWFALNLFLGLRGLTLLALLPSRARRVFG
ncbi:MAG: MATE family efflux transporter [Roseitalea porphyridii]|uniref:MATE family efflux transporter n=1 Tax=Roseitalea porphyridii TaxID=1852022 RepID=UPI0032D956CB